MNMLKHASLFCIILVTATNAFSQKFDSLLTIQRTADPQEKIYVHFDKSYYNPGETIWFKAYLFTGIEPSVKSKNFYAELLDAQGAVISRITAPIIFAGAAGSFELDSNFTKPAVYFRGYTIAVLNSDTSFLYTKAIRILSPKASAAKAPTPQPAHFLSFFPEGGDWVKGQPATVAFLATNQQGWPVNVTGNVMDNNGAKVAEIKTLHNGMGSFAITPEENRTYTATWKTGGGKVYTTPLPLVRSRGVSLKVGAADGQIRFSVYRTEEATEAQKQLHVIGHMNQYPVFEAKVNLSAKTAATGLFPTKDLPSGLLQITVFDNNHQPLAERITFVNNHDFEFDGDVYLTQKAFTRRGLNKLEIAVSDTALSNLSLAVTDADLNERNEMDENIISRLRLSGELRGRIVDPYYYFFSNNDSTAFHLDLVMLTHGWRRYKWEDVLAGKAPTAGRKESNYLTLNGQVAGLPPGSYSADLQLTGILQTSDSARSIITLPVDRKGNVSTDGLIFYDQAKLSFNFNKKSLSFDKSMLLVNNGLYNGPKKVALDSAMKLQLADVSTGVIASNQKITKLAEKAKQQLAKVNTLENVTVKAKVKTAREKMEAKYANGLFTGDANSFDLVNDPLAASYMNIFQFLQGRVAGLQINTGGGTPSLSWRGGTPALYLNEMQADINMLSSTPVSDIAYVKVFRPGQSIVSGGGGGVIAIYTRKGGDAQPDPTVKSLNAVQLTGYSPIKEFYSPDYAKPSERDGIDDVRSTLYWNPAIYLDKSRKRLRLQFYNNDVTKRFRLILEGLNADGKLIHVEKVVGN